MNLKGIAVKASLIAACAALASSAWADTRDEMLQWIEDNAGARKYTPEEAMNTPPPGPNPFVSLRPEGAEVNESYWRARNAAMSASRISSAQVADVQVSGRGRGKTSNGHGFLLIGGALSYAAAFVHIGGHEHRRSHSAKRF